RSDGGVPRRPAARSRARDAPRKRPPGRRRPRVRGRSDARTRAGGPTGHGMTTTDYEAIPAVAADDAARHVGTIVMKFGGTSVGDPEKLKNVAQRLVAARALGAQVCEIYTDVDGVYTADPRLVPGARKLEVLSFEEMLEMASSGARVMATRAIEVARSHNVRLHVRSTFNDAEGTWIREEDEKMLEKALISGVVHQREET